MKKIILSLVVLIGLGATQAFAQKTSFGVKAEANLSNSVLSDMANTKSTLGVGGNIGGFAKVELGQWFALQPELMLTLQNSKLDVSGVKNNIRSWGVEVPVYALFQLPATNTGRAYVGVGPYASYGLSAKNRTADLSLYSKNGADKSFLNRFDAGLAATIGYEFTNRIQINASYKRGILDELNTNSKESSLRSQRISLGVGYRF